MNFRSALVGFVATVTIIVGVAPLTVQAAPTAIYLNVISLDAFDGSQIAAGNDYQRLFDFTIEAKEHPIEIRNFRGEIRTSHGCQVKQSKGTPSFSHVTMTNNAGEVEGPLDLDASVPNSSTVSNVFRFNNVIRLEPFTTKYFTVHADATSTEDTPGNWVSNPKCVARFNLYRQGYGTVYDLTLKRYLNPFTEIYHGTNTERVTASILTGDPKRVLPFIKPTIRAVRIRLESDVEFGAPPAVDNLVANQHLAFLESLNFRGDENIDTPVQIHELTFTGQATDTTCPSFGGSPCNHAALSKYLGPFRLLDPTSTSTDPVTHEPGWFAMPDPVTGRVTFKNLHFVIPKGTPMQLLLHASVTSTISDIAPLPRVAVGIASDSDVHIDDSDGVIYPSLDGRLREAAIGTSVTIIHEIHPIGEIFITALHEKSHLVPADGGSAWQVFARYRLDGQFEASQIYGMNVKAVTGDGADFQEVGLQLEDGSICGHAILPSGPDASTDLDFSDCKTILAMFPGAPLTFNLVGRMSSALPSSAVGGATIGVPRSGHTPSLAINDSVTTDFWNPAYFGKLNIAISGNESGRALYINASSALKANPLVMRKAFPVVTVQEQPWVLMNGENTLIHFTVAPNTPSSTIAWKQIALHIKKIAGMPVSHMRLIRNGVEVPATTYSIINTETGEDLKTGSIPASATSVTAILSFKPGTEEMLSGSGAQYILRAQALPEVGGSHIFTSFFRDPAQPIVTGYLSNSPMLGCVSSTDISHIDTSDVADGISDAAGTFVWSDVSELPHSPSTGIDGGSRDWTNDTLVQGLTAYQWLVN